MPLAIAKHRPRVTFTPPDPPPITEGTGSGPPLLTVAGNGAPASVSSTADYVINSTAGSTGSNGAQVKLLAAATAAGSWSGITYVGDFYLTDTLDLSAFEGFTLYCPPGQARLLPANSFPNNKPMVTFGNSTTFKPFNNVENMELVGLYHSYSGSTAPVTLTKTIHGLRFASAYGTLRNLTISQCTGWGIDLSAPNGLVDDVAVNRNTGTIIMETNVNRCLTGNVRFGDGRCGEDVTFMSGVSFHAGKQGNTNRLGNAHAMQVHADDVRIVQIQPYAPTGANLNTVGRVKRLMTINYKPEGAGSDITPDWGAVHASGGGEQWILSSLATRTGTGTCLDLRDVDDSIVIGCILSGETKAGQRGVGAAAIDVTNGSNNVFAAVRIVRAKYLVGSPVVSGDNGTHEFDAVSGWTA